MKLYKSELKDVIFKFYSYDDIDVIFSGIHCCKNIFVVVENNYEVDETREYNIYDFNNESVIYGCGEFEYIDEIKMIDKEVEFIKNMIRKKDDTNMLFDDFINMCYSYGENFDDIKTKELNDER